jgi:putative flavoprotein involved in K+ transport
MHPDAPVRFGTGASKAFAMKRTDVIIVGAGQAGLAMSQSLSRLGIDHVVLERGRIGERWRSERWNSLRLLTTSAHSVLPGLQHEGVDPERFLPAADFTHYLDRYAAAFTVPVVTDCEVLTVEISYGGFQVATAGQCWYARAVIVATGACDVPYRPPEAARLPTTVEQILPANYRAPEDLPDGNVLVIGASSTGVQLADEIHRSGRPVTLAVGDHTRMVRRYRGRDIYDWMHTVGILDDPADESGNLKAARNQPSLQLAGRADHSNLDLPTLERQGVRLVGRLGDVDGDTVSFHGDLEQTTLKSHMRMLTTLQRIDRFIDGSGESAPPSEVDRIWPFLKRGTASAIDLRRQNIKSVVWAVGYRRRYDWLTIPVLDENGEIIHRGGVTKVPGLYVIGLTFLRTRRSSFIDGCGLDAGELARLVCNHLRHPVRKAA